ncbi:hypothetical protein V8D89_000926 [Ganoderma adspersum]
MIDVIHNNHPGPFGGRLTLRIGRGATGSGLCAIRFPIECEGALRKPQTRIGVADVVHAGSYVIRPGLTTADESPPLLETYRMRTNSKQLGKPVVNYNHPRPFRRILTRVSGFSARTSLPNVDSKVTGIVTTPAYTIGAGTGSSLKTHTAQQPSGGARAFSAATAHRRSLGQIGARGFKTANLLVVTFTLPRENAAAALDEPSAETALASSDSDA